MRPRELVILGTHAFAEEVADLVSECPDLALAAFAENQDRSRCDRPLLGKPVIWIDDLASLAKTHVAVCAIGTTHRRQFTEPVEAMGFELAVVRHPTARVSPTATLGGGTIVSVGVIVASHTTIGRHVILNRGVLVGHHTNIGDHVTISPGANIAGKVQIGDGVYVGMGAIVMDYLSIGASSVVGAGAVVTKAVPDHVQVLGIPARITKRDMDGR